MTIGQMKGRLESLNEELVSETSINNTSEHLTEQNTAQMYAGKNKLGEEIGTYKSTEYAVRKHQMNPAPGYGVPDLKKSGKYYRGMYAEAQGNVIDIESVVPYAKYLVHGNTKGLAGYGEKIYGLGGKWKNFYVNTHLRPEFIRNIKNQLSGR
jgi:hypothetical protein